MYFTFVFLFFFFKQKTAYEMRISDWSSDVCSSDLKSLFPPGTLHPIISPVNFKYYGRFQLSLQAKTKYVWIFDDDVLPGSRFLELLQIGRASCRERVCQYV